MAHNQPEILLSAQRLSCIKQDRVLFEDLSFDVKAGDIVIIGGENGAGKTSLLRIMAGLSMPNDGDINYLNESIFDFPEQYRQDLLYIGHSAGVKSELTASENLSFYLKLQGTEPTHELVLEYLTNVGLYAFDDATAATLSAGQKRRIALAQLWLQQNRVWILDEPFTAIDTKGVSVIEQQIQAHSEQGGCVLMTTHQTLSIDPKRLTFVNLTYRF
jgi:heme exporter protein A